MRRLVVTSVSSGATRSLTGTGDSAESPAWQPGVDLALSVRRLGQPRRRQPARVRIAVRNQLLSPAFNVALTISIPWTARVVRVRADRGRCRRQRPLACSLPTLLVLDHDLRRPDPPANGVRLANDRRLGVELAAGRPAGQQPGPRTARSRLLTAPPAGLCGSHDRRYRVAARPCDGPRVERKSPAVCVPSRLARRPV